MCTGLAGRVALGRALLPAWADGVGWAVTALAAASFARWRHVWRPPRGFGCLAGTRDVPGLAGAIRVAPCGSVGQSATGCWARRLSARDGIGGLGAGAPGRTGIGAGGGMCIPLARATLT